MKTLVKITLVLAGILASNTTATSQQIDTTFYYRLTNAFLKEGRSLDTYSSGENKPFMGRTGNYSGQFWKFTPNGDGSFRITNAFLGEGRSLDTYSNENNQPFMGQTGNYSGQRWYLTPVGGGYYRLTNAFLGRRRPLDTYSGTTNDPFMGDAGAYSGQVWKLTKLVPIASVTNTRNGEAQSPFGKLICNRQ